MCISLSFSLILSPLSILILSPLISPSSLHPQFSHGSLYSRLFFLRLPFARSDTDYERNKTRMLSSYHPSSLPRLARSRPGELFLRCRSPSPSPILSPVAKLARLQIGLPLRGERYRKVSGEHAKQIVGRSAACRPINCSKVS